MSGIDDPKFKWARFSGEVSVEPFTRERLPEKAELLITIGPTGAGKSSLIESFAGKSQPSLSISKNQLDPYTQTVSCYQLVNVRTYSGKPIFLVDTPGFSDSKTSELEVLEMIRIWLLPLRPRGETNFTTHIYFLIPIDQKKLAGSRRRTIDVFRTLFGVWQRFDEFTFVTTMWDALHNDRARELAESRFAELRDEVLQDFIARGANIIRFTNTKEAALKILRYNWNLPITFKSLILANSAHGMILYLDLVDRLKEGLQKQRDIEDGLASPHAETLPELRAILKRDYEDNSETLWKFLLHYLKFSGIPQKLEGLTYELDKAILAGFRFLQPPSSYSNLLAKYVKVDLPSSDVNWEFHQALRYAFHCECVKRALDEKAISEINLARVEDTTNMEAKYILEDNHIENQRVLWKAIAQWITHDPTPMTFRAITTDIRESVMTSSDICQLDPEYENLFYLWKHDSFKNSPYCEPPFESGRFPYSAGNELKKKRREFEESMETKTIFRRLFGLRF